MFIEPNAFHNRSPVRDEMSAEPNTFHNLIETQASVGTICRLYETVILWVERGTIDISSLRDLKQNAFHT